MLTIDKLNALGADTADGLRRCLNNEAFYLRLCGMAISDDGFEKLRDAVEAGDLTEGFERAHALKGVLANVALTELLGPVAEVTEELRAGNDIDYAPYIERIFCELGKLREAAASE